MRLLIALVWGVLLLPQASAWAGDLVILAASSTAKPLAQAIAKVCQPQMPSHMIRLSFAASNVLAEQIEHGGFGDVFISADQKWADYLEQKHLVTGVVFTKPWRNHLVVITPKDNPRSALDFMKMSALESQPNLKIATGAPDSVPQGIYAKQALLKSHQWVSLAPFFIPTANAAQTLLLVARREVDYGIVYASDAALDARVKIVAVIPPDLYDPVIYPIALVNPPNLAAQALVRCLDSEATSRIFKAYGFTP